jgi:hypothetical protein
LPRLARSIPLFHVADGRSGISHPGEVRVAKCRPWVVKVMQVDGRVAVEF